MDSETVNTLIVVLKDIKSCLLVISVVATVASTLYSLRTFLKLLEENGLL